MQFIKCKNRKYYKNVTYHSDKTTISYYKLIKNNMTLLASFSRTSGLCSSSCIQGFNIYHKQYIKDIYTLIKQDLKNLGNSSTLYSIQNTTKIGYKELLEIDFIDVYRLPGNYTQSQVKGENKDNCLSIMVYKQNDTFYNRLKKAMNKTIKNLKLKANEGNL